jgi:hypothetical protein
VQAGAVTGPSFRATTLLVLVWVGGLLAATSVGLLAVRLVATQVGDPAVAPLSAVAAATGAATPGTVPTLTATTAPPSSPAAPLSQAPTVAPPTARPSTAPAAPAPATRTFTTAAGTVGVQCTGTALRLVYATPAQGWTLDERSVGGSEAEVRFRGAGSRLRVRLSCASGAPTLVEQRTDPDGGGGDDGPEDDDGGDDD